MFYIAFEFVFFLLFFYISGWGYRVRRLRASFYMVFFTVVVSLPFLVFLVYESSVSLRFFFFCSDSDLWIFCFLVFFVKLPIYGLHIWLPKAHVESPLGGSMILAGVLLKLGGYGLTRFSFSLLGLFFNWGYFFFFVGLSSGLLGCFLCFRQVDFKSLVAYSSISHMGMALAGCFSFRQIGIEGSMLMFFGHGFCSSCLFFLVNLLYKRLFSRRALLWGLSGYQIYGSLLVFSVFFFFNMALPPFVSFVSEYFIFFCCVFFD